MTTRQQPPLTLPIPDDYQHSRVSSPPSNVVFNAPWTTPSTANHVSSERNDDMTSSATGTPFVQPSTPLSAAPVNASCPRRSALPVPFSGAAAITPVAALRPTAPAPANNSSFSVPRTRRAPVAPSRIAEVIDTSTSTHARESVPSSKRSKQKPTPISSTSSSTRRQKVSLSFLRPLYRS